MTTPPLDLTALRDAVTQYPSLHMWGSPLVARLLDRVEESDGLLARLSASGGRNIDLLARAESAERDLAAVTASRDGWQTRAETAEKAVARIERLSHAVRKLAGWSGNDIADLIEDGLIKEGDLS